MEGREDGSELIEISSLSYLRPTQQPVEVERRAIGQLREQINQESKSEGIMTAKIDDLTLSREQVAEKIHKRQKLISRFR